MQVNYILYLEGKEESFSGSSDYLLGEQMSERIIEYISRPAREGCFVKYRVEDNLEKFDNEVKAYQLLHPFGLCPKLLGYDHQEFRCYNVEEGEEFTLYGYYIETELFGISLHERFPILYPLAAGDTSLETVKDIDAYFNYPIEINQKIKHVLERMHELGIVHDDMHGGNLLITGEGEDAQIKIIDFELCEFRED
ncbi:CAMK/CAMK1 family protein kinase [Cedratvirus Zaza IHUMI]|uniref:CAMK/CAMK1 family protein kinase n=1 Tax=Cedratvirus Zaza IHUMI TaxID=2126979 RepID=A0A2R8FFM0_9VIRU|nr:CAMK/CAMK1 family protein kinase [Cedratvirus Zaza IHUMI]